MSTELTNWDNLETQGIDDLNTEAYGEFAIADYENVPIYLGTTTLPVKYASENLPKDNPGNVVEKYHAIIAPYKDTVILSNVKTETITAEQIRNRSISHPVVLVTYKKLAEKAALAEAGDERYNGYLFLHRRLQLTKGKLHDSFIAENFTRENAEEIYATNEEVLNELIRQARLEAEKEGLDFDEIFNF